eukprot:TRINITY_DN15217_c0_g1_i1.p1 TRINITY_DN15217_c0_g1~~TRINITY_DN15217_c0_g1_i1.p1  ORF type:complete len:326 (-),score=42.36 TRINITY_DN15217_c0_g1_i1:380-1357(-)
MINLAAYDIPAALVSCLTAAVLGNNVYNIVVEPEGFHVELLFVMVAEASWGVALGRLLWNLCISSRRSSSHHVDECQHFSLQTLILYTSGRGIIAFFPTEWRWYDLPPVTRDIVYWSNFLLLFLITTFVGRAQYRRHVSQSDGRTTSWLLEETHGNQIVTHFFPHLAEEASGAVKIIILSWFGLLAVVLFMAMFMYACEPEETRRLDKQRKTNSILTNSLEVVDALAILPQFMKMRQSMGEDLESVAILASLPRTLVDWLAMMSFRRVLQLVDSFLHALTIDLGEQKSDEAFYMLEIAFTVLILGDFFYYYIRSQLKLRGMTIVK